MMARFSGQHVSRQCETIRYNGVKGVEKVKTFHLAAVILMPATASLSASQHFLHGPLIPRLF